WYRQPGRRARRRRGRSESPAEARGHNVGGQVQDLGVPDEESAAHLAALIGGTDLVDQPAGRDGQGTPTHTGADIYGAGTLVEAKPVRVDEADGQTVQGTADVLVDVGNVVQIALSVGEASIGAAILTDSAELMGIRVPQLIAGGVDDVPAEPPVPHRGRDARHVGQTGHHDDAAVEPR